MSANRSCKFLVNLPVRDLKRSIEFFTKLGFAFNAKMTGEDSACMILSEEASVMMLPEERFKGFVTKPLSDARTSIGAVYCIMAASRADVDHVVKTAIASGGTLAEDKPTDHGFMYDWSFYDLDGYGWQVFYMDSSAF